MTAKFAAKSAKNPKSSHWFQPAPVSAVNTRSNKKISVFASVPTRTEMVAHSIHYGAFECKVTVLNLC